MVPKLRSRVFRPVRVAGGAIVALLVCLGWAAMLLAEDPPVHYLHAGILSPGAIGNQQLQRGGPLPGYFQPVEVTGPEGLVVETAESGDFANAQAGPVRIGLLIGSVYRLRVTGIPLHEGMEVYPTIEVIDRLYPPMGMEFQFAIPVELTQEELEMALDGKFVTRVIYLEDSASGRARGTRAERSTVLRRGRRRESARPGRRTRPSHGHLADGRATARRRDRARPGVHVRVPSPAPLASAPAEPGMGRPLRASH